ncbi:MAG: hypothetical protein U0263_22900 [Polyangiaceae bacterium]
MHEDEIRKVQLELTGTERSLTGVLTLLGFLQGSAKFGTTQWVKLMVDGDGGFSIAIARDGAAWELSEEEANYLFAEQKTARSPRPRWFHRSAAPRRTGAKSCCPSSSCDARCHRTQPGKRRSRRHDTPTPAT